METKRLVIGAGLAMLVVFGWSMLQQQWLWKKYPSLDPRVQQQQAAATNPAAPGTQPATRPGATQPADTRPATTQGVAAGPEGGGTDAARDPAAAPAGPHVVAPAEPAVPALIGSAQHKDPAYALQLQITPAGAGLDAATLNGFKRAVDDPRPYVFQEPYAGYEAASRSLATRSVTVNGTPVDLLGANWGLVESGPASATYAVTVADATGPLLRVRKTFRVFERDSAEHGGQGYEIGLDYAFENHSKQPVTVKAVMNGPTAPRTELRQTIGAQVLTGYWSDKYVELVQTAASSFAGGEASRDLTRNDDRPLAWAGVGSDYFEAILLPLPAAGGTPSGPGRAGYVGKLQVDGVRPPGSNDDDMKIQPVITLETADLQIAPGQQVSAPFNVYLGPKWRSVLDTAHYATAPRQYDSTLVAPTMWLCSLCTFQWLISFLVVLLNTFHWLLGGFAGYGDWGLAIIALVVLVRTLLHPVTKRSQVHMLRMGKMGPEMERLKKKHGDNKEELNKAMMQLYKEQGFTPVLGCLPMFLQMPIWIALYAALQSTFELRHSPFLKFGDVRLTWIKDLAQPDHLVTFARPFEWWFIYIDAINLLPLLLAVVFYIQAEIQQRLQPKGTPEQEQQKKMMKWMTLLFPVFLYSGPSGLNLYIFTSTVIGIIESKIIRKHIKEREEAEKLAAPVVVEAGKLSRVTRRGKDDPEPPVARKGGLMGWLTDLQARAEQMRREQERRGRDKA